MNKCDKDGKTPLALACSRKSDAQASIVQQLLTCRPNVGLLSPSRPSTTGSDSSTYSPQRTPLMLAALLGAESVVRLLLGVRTDPVWGVAAELAGRELQAHLYENEESRRLVSEVK
jgi:ankyrin repeat protein